MGDLGRPQLHHMEKRPMTVIDPEMDMTQDEVLIMDTTGTSYFMTDTSKIDAKFFGKYVRGKKFIDLGSGDGRIVSFALQCGANAFGIEQDPKFVKMSAIPRRIKQGDFMSVDFTKYDVVFYALASNKNHDLDYDLLQNLQHLKGTLMIWHRRVPHRLPKFEEALISKGFSKVEKSEFLTVYQK